MGDESVILSAEEKEYLFLIRRAFESANPGKRLLALVFRSNTKTI